MTNKVYNKVLLNKKLLINFNNINNNLLSLASNILKKNIEGKCVNEGFIKPDTINIINYSTGELFTNKVEINFSFECLVANPVENDILECIVKSITKVGIRAELNNDDSNALVIFIARDHHYNNQEFSNISENDIINVRVIGKRYEINDTFIALIAELIQSSDLKTLSNKSNKYSKSNKSNKSSKSSKSFISKKSED